MPLHRTTFLTGLLIFLLAACQAGTPQATPTPLPRTAAPTQTRPVPTAITPPTATGVTPVKSVTPTTPLTPVTASPVPATAAPTTAAASPTPPPTRLPPTALPTAMPNPNLPEMLDDRSTPTGLILSYFNAINRKEYLRAYAYYRTPSQTAGAFDTFVNGFQNTVSVAVTLGSIGGDNGAGQIYYTVPALLKTTNSGGGITSFAACYILHLSQPGVQGTPPFAPLGIKLGKAIPVANDAAPAAALASACSGPDFPQSRPITPAPQTNLQDISSANYLDERSSAVNVVKSLLNAINRKEYLRAYSYWENPASVPGPFAAYQQGFAATASVEATFGTVTSEGAAGQLYYKVPVAEKVKNTNGSLQTFVGCYTLHLSQPLLQYLPPYAPLSITRGSLNLAANNADIPALLAAACTQP